MGVVKKCGERLRNVVKEKVREVRWRFLGLDWRKVLLTLVPMVAAFYAGDKLGWLYRYCPGNNTISRMAVLMANAGMAFQSPLPSLYGDDLAVGAIAAFGLAGLILYRRSSAKKFRQGVEYPISCPAL